MPYLMYIIYDIYIYKTLIYIHIDIYIYIYIYINIYIYIYIYIKEYKIRQTLFYSLFFAFCNIVATHKHVGILYIHFISFPATFT